MNQQRLDQVFGTGEKVEREEATSTNVPRVIQYITIDKRKITKNYFYDSAPETDIQRAKGGTIMNETRIFLINPRLKIDQHLLTLVKTRARTGSRVSIKRMREITSKIKGSMSEAVVEERNRERW